MFVKDIKIFPNKKKKKNRQYGTIHVTKISQKMKKINLLIIEKKIVKLEKTLYYNYKKVF